MSDSMTFLAVHAGTAAVVASAAWIASRLIRHPLLRHLLWVAVLIKLLIPAPIRVPVSVTGFMSYSSSEQSASERLRSYERQDALPPGSPERPDRALGDLAAVTRSAFEPLPIVHTSEASAGVLSTSFSSSLSVSSLIAIVWLAGTTLVLLATTGRAWRFSRWMHGAASEAADAASLTRSLCEEIDLRPVPRVLAVDAAVSPMLWAVFRPEIVVPRELWDRLDEPERRTILLHELAHLARGDHWVRRLECLVTALWWWHPAVWVARRELHAAEEECCDAWVVARRPEERRRYAEAILSTLDHLADRRPALPPSACGISGTTLLERRLTMILTKAVPAKLGIPTRLTVAAAFIAAVSFSPTLGEEPTPDAAVSATTLADRDTADPVPTPIDPLAEAVRAAIRTVKSRRLNAELHTPWQIAHGVLAFGSEHTVRVDETEINTVDWIATNPDFRSRTTGEDGMVSIRDLNWFYSTSDGPRPQKYTGTPYEFEGHPHQFLAFFAAGGVPLSQTFDVGGEAATLRDLLATAKSQTNDEEDMTWVLWALASVGDVDSPWIDAAGRSRSVEQLAMAQVSRDFWTAPDGGTHSLTAVAAARRAHRLAGAENNEVWRSIDDHLEKHINLARSLQNRDGSFSSNHFRGASHSNDPSKRISTTGHTLMFLVTALPPDRLGEPWVRAAVDRLARDLILFRATPLEVGGMYTATFALANYERFTRRTVADADRTAAEGGAETSRR